MKTDTRILLLFTIVARLLTVFLLLITSLLPLFDSSPNILPTPKWSWITSLLRWDAFHFVHIAEHGYVYENEWAFFPGTPFLMRTASSAIRFVTGSVGPPDWSDLLLGGALAALACDTTSTFYQLSLHHLGSPSVAFLASLLSLLPSSPVTLRFAAYSEPLFTYLSYKGGYHSECA